jgi:hypothetical protein
MSKRQREKNTKRYIQQLSYKGLEVLLMDTQHKESKVTDITGDPRFRRVAAAIRQSTVIPQIKHAKGEDAVYEIRYGLIQELLRRARSKVDFLADLSNFLSLYSAENARVLERALKAGEKKPKWSRVKIDYRDIEAISALIDKFDSSEVIAKMLVACGYASDYSGPKGQNEASDISTENEEMLIDEITDEEE